MHATKNEENSICVKGSNSISAATAAAAYDLDISLTVQNLHELGVKSVVFKCTPKEIIPETEKIEPKKCAFKLVMGQQKERILP